MIYNFYNVYGHVYKLKDTIVHKNEYMTITYKPSNSNLKSCYLDVCNDLLDLEASTIRPIRLRNRIIKIK